MSNKYRQNEAISVPWKYGIELGFSSGSFYWISRLSSLIEYATSINTIFEIRTEYIDNKLPKRAIDFFHTIVEPLNWLRTYIIYVELGNSTHYMNLEVLSSEYDKLYGTNDEESTTYETFEALIHNSRMIVDHLMLVTYVSIWSLFECDLSVLYDKYNAKKDAKDGYISIQNKIDQIYSKKNIKTFMKDYSRDIDEDRDFLKAAADFRNTIHNNGIANKKIVFHFDDEDLIIKKNEGMKIPRGDVIPVLIPILRKIYIIYTEIICSYISYTSDEKFSISQILSKYD